MAYLNILASVAPERVSAYRADRSTSLKATQVITVSHLLAFDCWVPVQPIGGILARALEEGAPLSPDLWHPCRPPLLHAIESVRAIAPELDRAWQDFVKAHPQILQDDFFGVQIRQTVQLFRLAADSQLQVVSILDRPTDAARANRVEIPRLN